MVLILIQPSAFCTTWMKKSRRMKCAKNNWAKRRLLCVSNRGRSLRISAPLGRAKFTNNVLEVVQPCASLIWLCNEIEPPAVTQSIKEKSGFARSRCVNEYPRMTRSSSRNKFTERQITHMCVAKEKGLGISEYVQDCLSRGLSRRSSKLGHHLDRVYTPET